METPQKTRGTITKAEICDLYEFSSETLRIILNVHLYEELKPLGYKKRCKLVPNVVYRKFQELWGGPLNA